MMIRRLAGSLLVAAFLAYLVPAPAAADDDDAVAVALLRHFIDLYEGESVLPVAEIDALQVFYEGQGLTLQWLGPDVPAARVEGLLSTLEEAGEEGLDPADYAAALALAPQLDDITDLDEMAAADITLAAAALHYGWDLQSGRGEAQIADPELFPITERVPADHLLWDLAAVDDVGAYFQGLAPAHVAYRRLRSALALYRQLAADGGWAVLADGHSLKPGMEDARVPALAARLAVTGDLLETTGDDQGTLYGPVLEAAVRRFQERHGLDVDGVVGPGTLAALNVPAEARVRQIAINMERWRWIGDELADRYLWVNIPGFSLQVVENGRVVMAMPVIIGRTYRETPVFAGLMTYLDFNPYWNVPTSIATQDLLPKIQADQSYLARQGMSVLSGWSEDAVPIDPVSIDWARLSQDNFPYRLRQDPGPLNALGRVKFMFPNSFSVYLHDTPSRELFWRAKRDFSSGCIRVQKPLELAEFLLGSGWDLALIEAEIATGQNHAVRLPHAVPIFITYSTAWVDDDGAIEFRDDIYGRDAVLIEALAAR